MSPVALAYFSREPPHGFHHTLAGLHPLREYDFSSTARVFRLYRALTMGELRGQQISLKS